MKKIKSLATITLLGLLFSCTNKNTGKQNSSDSLLYNPDTAAIDHAGESGNYNGVSTEHNPMMDSSKVDTQTK